MNYIWTQDTAAQATGAQATGGNAHGAWQVTRVVIDSRAIQPGDLFVALKGERFDGHDYVAEALSKGAAAAMVSQRPANLAAEAPLLEVSDTLKGLEDLARAARKRSRAHIIGVTGSVGKTSTKEMLKLALSAHGSVYATSGNYNNHIGTPLNLANLPQDTQFAIFEMGMNHAGEIAHLTRMVQPQLALITNVEAAHLEFFASVEAIADAKAEIFEGVVTGGAAVLNAENAYVAQLEHKAHAQGISRIMLCGGVAVAQCRLLAYQATRDGAAIEAEINGMPLAYTLKATGRHWALTSLMTLAVTHLLGLSDAVTARALSGFEELSGRGSMVPIEVQGGQALLIDDSYNASPAAMRAAFTKTAEVWQARGGTGRKIAVLGNMLELGEGAPDIHAALAEGVITAGFDRLYTAGALMEHLHHAVPSSMRGAHAADAASLLPLVRHQLQQGDIVLVKGSHGSQLYTLAEALKQSAGT